jgi:hypothetical protein
MNYSQTIGVAAGLAYLHSQDMVHGNLCTVRLPLNIKYRGVIYHLQKKVLIDGHGSPVICGYGMSTTLSQSADTTSLFSFPIRFAAPECFSDEAGTSSVRTTSRDVYNFSMVALEVFFFPPGPCAIFDFYWWRFFPDLNRITIYPPSTLFWCIFLEVVGQYAPIWTSAQSLIAYGNFSLCCGIRTHLRDPACRMLCRT